MFPPKGGNVGWVKAEKLHLFSLSPGVRSWKLQTAAGPTGYPRQLLGTSNLMLQSPFDGWRGESRTERSSSRNKVMSTPSRGQDAHQGMSIARCTYGHCYSFFLHVGTTRCTRTVAVYLTGTGRWIGCTQGDNTESKDSFCRLIACRTLDTHNAETAPTMDFRYSVSFSTAAYYTWLL